MPGAVIILLALLVFVTKMAKTGANQYQSKINEIAVTGN